MTLTLSLTLTLNLTLNLTLTDLTLAPERARGEHGYLRTSHESSGP